MTGIPLSRLLAATKNWWLHSESGFDSDNHKLRISVTISVTLEFSSIFLLSGKTRETEWHGQISWSISLNIGLRVHSTSLLRDRPWKALWNEMKYLKACKHNTCGCVLSPDLDAVIPLYRTYNVQGFQVILIPDQRWHFCNEHIKWAIGEFFEN